MVHLSGRVETTLTVTIYNRERPQQHELIESPRLGAAGFMVIGMARKATDRAWEG
jgi:hypothetical protein